MDEVGDGVDGRGGTWRRQCGGDRRARSYSNADETARLRADRHGAYQHDLWHRGLRVEGLRTPCRHCAEGSLLCRSSVSCRGLCVHASCLERESSTQGSLLYFLCLLVGVQAGGRSVAGEVMHSTLRSPLSSTVEAGFEGVEPGCR